MLEKIFGSLNKQRKWESSPKNQEFLLNNQTADSQTQSWLDQNYLKESRNQVKSLEIVEKGLAGLLNLVDFSNLEELYCYGNQLTGIRFADNSFEKLRILHVGNNNFPEQSLCLFNHLTGLEVLNLSNNGFKGNLKVLENLVNLQSLDISNTNIDSGLIHLSERLESLFCRTEKEAGCQKIREELKYYDLGHDCYDFQTWKKEEDWLAIPGSWPKNTSGWTAKYSLGKETPKKEKESLVLLSETYQKLVSVEKNTLASLEKDIEEIRKVSSDSIFCKFKDEFELDLDNLALVAERYVLASKRIWILEEELKKTRQENKVLAEKNEFWKFLQLELTKQDKETEKTINPQLKSELSLKRKYKKNIINTMTNTNNLNNKKIHILEWNSAELKDGTMRYEKFKVITGNNKENLNFYTTFFTGKTKFKKGEFYQLSTPGNFVQDASEIIQGIDNGGYEFEKIYPSLLIKELWEEKIEKNEKIDLLEADLEKKKQEVNRINQELTDKKIEFNNLQSKFNILQTEKTNGDEKISSLERSIQEKDKKIQETEQKSKNLEEEKKQLKGQLTSLQGEKKQMENDWVSPDQKIQLLQEKEHLNGQLKTERRSNQGLIESLEDFQTQQLNETIQDKLERKKKELNNLKVGAGDKAGESQRSLLETLLEKQEDFDLALFENVDRSSRTFSRAQEKLQEVKDKLIANLDSEEIEELCKMQTEISKLENSRSQWEKMESFTSVPPHNSNK